MKSSASKIKLESYGNLFGKSELPTLQRVVDDTEQVVEIPLAKLYTFENHPFKVIDDEKMDELVESIKANGLLDMVDANQIGFMQGIEIAYLSEEEQKWIAELIEQYTIRMNLEQAKKLKKLKKRLFLY